MKTVILLSFFTWFAHTSHTPTYEEVFNGDYQRAEAFLAEKAPLFRQYCASTKQMKVLQAVVFPEVIRYSSLRDLLETTALEMLYVSHGTQGADFSIGQFQMKPSFAESVEKEMQKIPGGAVFSYAEQSVQQVRKERLMRLQSVSWQIRYLIAFQKILKRKWGNTYPKASTLEEIKLLAAAYNQGMYKPPSILKKQAFVQYYPYGKRYTGKQYSYVSIALYYHKNSA